jgi:hypothetical protein
MDLPKNSKTEETVKLITFFLLLPLVTAAGISRLVKIRKDIKPPNKDMWE